MQSRKATPSKEAASSSVSASKSRDKDDLYTASTDDEQAPSGNKTELGDDGLPVLPDFFSGKTFLLYGKLKDRRTVLRYITAYNG